MNAVLRLVDFQKVSLRSGLYLWYPRTGYMPTDTFLLKLFESVKTGATYWLKTKNVGVKFRG